MRDLPEIRDLIGMDAGLRMVPTDRPGLRAAVDVMLDRLGPAPTGDEMPAGDRLGLLRRAGFGLIALDDLDAAVDLLTEALTLTGGDAAAEVAVRVNLGDAYRYGGCLDSAAEQYDAALERARANAPALVDLALHHLGKHLIDAGRPAEAIACLQEALALRRQKADATLVASTAAALRLAHASAGDDR